MRKKMNIIKKIWNRLFKRHYKYYCYLSTGPDRNGYIFDKNCMRKAIDKFNKKQNVIFIHSTDDINCKIYEEHHHSHYDGYYEKM